MGKWASDNSESKIIPKYSKHVLGPSVLWAAIGILSVLNNISSKAIVLSAMNSGGSIVKKSSSKYKIQYGTYSWLFSK